MSGVVKSIGKVFKKVGKVLKKIAPYVMIAAAIYFTGGALLAAAPAAGAAGAAGSGIVGAGGAVAGNAVVTSASGGWLASILGAGGSSALGGLLSNSTVGAVLGGGARGLMEKMQMDDLEKSRIATEGRAEQRHTIDVSSLFDFSGSGPSQGLGVTTADLTSPTTVVQNTASRPPRQSVVELAQVTPPDRRFKYNHATGVIDFA